MKIISVVLSLHILSSTLAAPVEEVQKKPFWHWPFGRQLTHAIQNEDLLEVHGDTLSSEINPRKNESESRGVNSYLSTLAGYLNLKLFQDTENEPSQALLREGGISEEPSTEFPTTKDTDNESFQVSLREGEISEEPSTEVTTTVVNEIIHGETTTQESQIFLSDDNEIFIEKVESMIEEIFGKEVESTTEEVSTEEIESMTEEVSIEEIESMTEEITSEKVESTTEELPTKEIESLTEEVSKEEIESTTERVSTKEIESMTEEITTEESKLTTKIMIHTTNQRPPVFENTHGIDFTECHPAFEQCDIVGIYSCKTEGYETVCGIRYKSRKVD